MAMTYDLLRSKIKSEGKITLSDLSWILEKMERLEKQVDKFNGSLDERLSKIEYVSDDHISGGL